MFMNVKKEINEPNYLHIKYKVFTFATSKTEKPAVKGTQIYERNKKKLRTV